MQRHPSEGGFALWFTGLSGSGKSTLSARIAAALRERGLKVEVLDGDLVRENLSRGLGFSKADRDENIRRIAFVAELLARNGVVAIAAAISPYRDTREAVRARFPKGRFVEVYCECPLEALVARDPKGLYERALRGEIRHFTGVDDPYEAPASAEVVVHTATESADASARRILAWLESADLVGDGVA